MRHRGAVPSGEHPAARRGGFTIVEMMVAVMIVTIGLLGMVSTSAVVLRQVGGGTQQTVAANVMQSRFEYFRSLPCPSIQDASLVMRGVEETWRRGTISNNVLSVRYRVKYSVAWSKRTHTYTVMVPCW